MDPTVVAGVSRPAQVAAHWAAGRGPAPSMVNYRSFVSRDASLPTTGTRCLRWLAGPAASIVLLGCGSTDLASIDTEPPIAPPTTIDESARTTPIATDVADTTIAPIVRAVDAATMFGMLLHLPDARPGATIGDDSYCGNGGLGSDGDNNAFVDLVVESRVEVGSCSNQLEAPSAWVDSMVVSFPDEEMAARALDPHTFQAFADHVALACCNSEPTGALSPASGPGTDALEAVSPSDTVAIVGWRSGAVLGAVAVQLFADPSGALDEARRLATVQDKRMRTPVAVTDEIDDDRLVGLAAAPFDTWWLGDSFEAPGLPPIDLFTTTLDDALATLDYSGVRIEIFDLNAIASGSQTDEILGVAAELFDSPCTEMVPLDSVAGDAVLLGRFVPAEFFGPPSPGRTGWGSLVDVACPIGAANVWMATIQFDDVLLRVNAPICYFCLIPPDQQFPYRQPEGLRAVVANVVMFDRSD